tara:strand:+ start:3301 stop:3702 length:402 start_codon:yes stop_codon:yes gene_type:complete
MGLFGGSKSSTSDNSVEVVQNVADNRVIESGNIGGNQSISIGGSSDNLTVTTTDFGALDAATEFVDRSLTSVDNALGAVNTMAGDAGSTIGAALEKVSDFATTQTGGTSSKTIIYLIAAVSVVAVALVMRKSK